MYERFADDALYSINIADPTTGKLIITYSFRFSPVYWAADRTRIRILNINDVLQNFPQTYTLSKVGAASMCGGGGWRRR